MDVYDEVTAYEVAFSFRDVPREVDLLTDWFERDGLGSLTSVIELAAGPADHALEFARRGITATALDINAAMCRRAEERRDAEQLTMHVIRADMTRFDVDSKADLALLMMDSATHLLSLDSMLGMLASTARAVRDGGLLVMEMGHPADFLTSQRRADVEWEEQRDDMTVKSRWGTPDDDLDPVSQVRQTTVTVETSRSGQAPVSAHGCRSAASVDSDRGRCRRQALAGLGHPLVVRRHVPRHRDHRRRGLAHDPGAPPGDGDTVGPYLISDRLNYFDSPDPRTLQLSQRSPSPDLPRRYVSWHVRSESTWGRPTRSSRSSKAASPPSSPTPRAPAPPRRWSPSPRPARSWSARSPSVRRSPTSTARSAR